MINYDEYKGYSLLHWYCDRFEEENVYGVIIYARIQGEWKILACCTSIKWFYNMIGVAVLNSAIVKCTEDPSELFWYITIDLEKTGKFDD